MSLFKKIKSSLEEAIEHEKSPKNSAARVRPRQLLISPAVEFISHEVRQIRLRMRLSQEQFAALIGVSSETVAKWEQGANSPARSSMRLLQILKEKPLLPQQLGIVIQS